MAFLRESLVDLDESLRRRRSGLILRRGDVVRETMAVAAGTAAHAVFLTADVSGYAQRRERRLARAARAQRLEVRTFPGVTVVPHDLLRTSTGEHFSVFTPYLRRWLDAPPRRPEPLPSLAPFEVADPVPGRRLLDTLLSPDRSPRLPVGGESAGRLRLTTWIRSGPDRYESDRDDLAGDTTSRLSPYLHFGCLSPAEVAERARGAAGDDFLRQLAWRDFFHQLLAARPDSATEDLRERGDRWRRSPAELDAWQTGTTGFPIVDAAMRQLREEGWMHNRARLITASFLAKTLYLDWRLGARHFFDLLVDGDVASNTGNWQWMAGTGADTRPNRILNPLRQAARFDPRGDYVRRHVAELHGLPAETIHRPWALGRTALQRLGYPAPIVDLGWAASRLRHGRPGPRVEAVPSPS
jgi:deoxyribodipyrimidine photo-lyase